MLNYYSQIVCNRWGMKPSIRNAEALAAFGFTLALAALSIFPHQEPRFLLPLLLPCVLLGANGLRSKVAGFRPLLWVWYAFNLAAFMFFGCVHQAGVVPAVRWLGQGMSLDPGVTEVSVVFSKTYMPPRFPLLEADKATLASPYVHNRPGVHFRFHDLAGSPELAVKNNLTALASRSDYLKDLHGTVTVLIAPRHVARDIEHEAGGELTLTALEAFFPHLSVEAPPRPDFDLLAEALMPTSDWRRRISFLGQFLDVLGDFSLWAYRVELSKSVKTVQVQTERTEHS